MDNKDTMKDEKKYENKEEIWTTQERLPLLVVAALFPMNGKQCQQQNQQQNQQQQQQQQQQLYIEKGQSGRYTNNNNNHHQHQRIQERLGGKGTINNSVKNNAITTPSSTFIRSTPTRRLVRPGAIIGGGGNVCIYQRVGM